MKKFIRRVFIFILPLFLLVFYFLIVYYYNNLKVKSELKDVSEMECLLMGDSQIQRLNPLLFSSKTKNIASSGEHFYFTYNKLLKILDNKNCKVEKVVLGASIHSFATVYNRLFDIDFPEGENSFKRYMYFISLLDNEDFFRLNDMPLLNYVSTIYSDPDWGGFFESEYSNPDSNIVNKTYNIHFSRDGGQKKYCQSQKKYLYKIDSLCATNNIELFICSLPYHAVYKEQIQECYYAFFDSTIEKFEGKNYINLLLEEPTNDWMSDANHLNKIGATFYSKKINKIINQSDLGGEN